MLPAGAWEHFSVPVENGGSIVGFFGSTGSSYLSAIGVYIQPFCFVGLGLSIEPAH
jgi:hypothetical protein